jgi:hypothetical protein
LSADGRREQWSVSGPHFAGWEVYHVKGSPLDPARIYASQTSSWFGQIIQRSSDGGRTWEIPGTQGGPPVDEQGFPKGESNKLVYDTGPGTGAPLMTHQWYDGTQRPWEFKRVWHIEPSLSDPDTAYAGVEDAGLFRTADGGSTWQPINCGLKSQYVPDPDAEVGHCVHRIAMHASRPETLYMQKHWDVMRSDDGGASWYEVSGDLPSDFGFPIEVHAHEPETIYVVPIKSDSEHYPPDGRLRVYRSRTGGNEWEPLTNGLPQQDCYVNVLRDAMADAARHDPRPRDGQAPAPAALLRVQ